MSEKHIFKPGVIPVEVVTEAKKPPVTSWSISKLTKFETCPYSVYLGDVMKVPDSGDLSKAERGTLIHTMAENYVKGEDAELSASLKKFERDFKTLREQFEESKVSVEGEWGFNRDWEPTSWFDKETWGRAKLDAFITYDPNCGKVIDHKTGKKYGNEIKHNFQGTVYAIAAFMRYPELQYIETEFWYLDHGVKLENSYTRDQAMVLLPRVTARAEKLTNCIEFKPRPSPMNCRFCNKKEGCDWRAD
ncbi:MAG: PD-(D/E)XK nuclease family protein [Hyphomicrobiaceae bacterium]|nr:MAG: PD-(D/E)XK nuclease family protein [Hyphomicrobiaceae bacterium]